MKAEQLLLRRAYIDWWREFGPERAIAVTITFKPISGGRCTPLKSAEETVRMFLRKANAKAYGAAFKRRGASLDVLSVREGGVKSHEKRLHYHLHLEVPEGYEVEEWIEDVTDVLSTMNSVNAKNCCLREVTSDGWLDYMLKQRDKETISDAVDVRNTWIKRSRSEC